METNGFLDSIEFGQQSLFTWKILPKISWFQDEALRENSLMAQETSWGKQLQESWTSLGKLGSLNQIVSSRKGFKPNPCWVGLVSRRMGLWSDETLGRWRTLASSNFCFQLRLQRTLSRRSITSPVGHLLVQVKRRPLNPKSKRLHASKQFLKVDILLWLAGVALNFSKLHKTSLKSPVTIHKSVYLQTRQDDPIT